MDGGNTTERPQGRVLTSGKGDIFKNAQGGRSDYGSLILTALTGMDETALMESIRKQIGSEKLAALQKKMATGGEVAATLLDAEDQFFMDYVTTGGGPDILAPPISPERLTRLALENNALEPCIATMVTNISGTGFKLAASHLSESELTEALKKKRDTLLSFFKEVYARQSFTKVRKALRRDLHTTGNSYAVVERTLTGDIAFIRRAPAKSMRIVKLDDPTQVNITLMRGGQESTLTTMRSERRFVQRIGIRHVYYKEYGASRDLNRTTGQWAAPGEVLPPNVRAHEIIHERDLEDTRSPYGVPRWITQLPSILGSRMAEEHNLAFFNTGGMPPVIIFVAGGSVSEQVQTALNNYLTGSSANKQRGVAVEIPSSGSMDKEVPANIQVERFGSDTADSTFETYDKNCETRVRRAFRIPGIFLGYSDSYNFATAHAAYAVCEEQVFKPERDDEDELWNMTIMRDLDKDGDFEIVSNPLSVKDVTLRLRGIELLKDTKGISLKSWVDTLNQATGNEIELTEDHEDRVIGVLEEGDLPPGLMGNAVPGQQTGQPADNDPDGEDDKDAPKGAAGTPPKPGKGAAPPAPPTPPKAPPAASAAKREGKAMAIALTRALRDYEDTGDLSHLDRLMELEQRFDAADPDARAVAEDAISRVMFTSPFLADAVALQDFAAGYAKAAFAEARRKRKGAKTAP